MEKRYEIRLNGETKCTSSLPKCGYPQKVFRQMIDAGYKYYIDGKYQKKSEAQGC